jgi:hypothetical protein
MLFCLCILRLDRARLNRSIVVTTPEAIKSLMLKYVDMLQSVQAATPLLSLPAKVLVCELRACHILCLCCNNTEEPVVIEHCIRV